jgi:hypothetical protein
MLLSLAIKSLLRLKFNIIKYPVIRGVELCVCVCMVYFLKFRPDCVHTLLPNLIRLWWGGSAGATTAQRCPPSYMS